MWLDDDEFDTRLSLAKVITFLKAIKKIQEWGYSCQTLSIEIELNELIAKLNRLLLVRFIRLQFLIPPHLRIPVPRVEVLQPLAGRAPPVAEIFIPIPKTEQGSCARSDLPAASAY